MEVVGVFRTGDLYEGTCTGFAFFGRRGIKAEFGQFR